MALALAPFLYILTRLHSLGAILFACAIFAVYAAVVILREKWRVHRTQKWPTVSGAIIDIKPEFVSGGNGVDYWRVNFAYTYSVDGTEYRGKYSVNCTNEDMSTRAAANLTGAQTSVHYDPAEPSKSVLWESEVNQLW